MASTWDAAETAAGGIAQPFGQSRVTRMPSPHTIGGEEPMRVTPDRAQPDWPPAVIAGAYQTGVLGMRSLVRRGVRASCFDCNPSHAGFRSVYGSAKSCPDPDEEPQAWLRFMRDLAREQDGRAALIPSSDKFVSSISRFADQLSEHYLLSPGVALQGLLADKQTQYRLAAEHGMPMPRTSRVQSLAEAEAFAREASFPCLVKPMHFREWQRFPAGHRLLGTKVAIAPNAEALLENYRLASQVNPCVILQEIIEGADTAKRVYLACYDSGGRRIAHAMFRELRCDPVGFGPASVSEPVVDPETDAVCDRFLRSIGYVGICEIEMKWDSRDGRVKLIEANPRLSGGGDAAPYAGVDLCWLHYLDLIGQPVRAVGPTGTPFRHVVLRADAAAVPAYLAARLISWREVLDSYRGRLAFYDLDRDDWRYSLETLLVSAKTLLATAWRSMFRKGMPT
jgi:predicted ATP-grasp superfamily ATP-dependent carboligase